MSNPDEILRRYDEATDAHIKVCHADPSHWHRADVAEFSSLKALLKPHAEAGHGLCQYALASIWWLGLCCENEEEYRGTYEAAIHEATRWWIAAASQGHWPALDNLITSGVGPEAERARVAAREVERQRPDLIGRSHGMPVYGPEFMQEVCRRFSARADKSTP